MKSLSQIRRKLGHVEREYLEQAARDPSSHKSSFYAGWHQALKWASRRGDEVIADEVVGTGRCSGCSACVVVCPTDVFDYNGDKPVNARFTRCIDCDLCVEACPELHLSDESIEQKSLDSFATEGDEFGRYGRALLTRSNTREIVERSQDGGTVSALLIYALETGIVDAAVVSGTREEKRLQPVARLVTSKAEIFEVCGVKVHLCS